MAPKMLRCGCVDSAKKMLIHARERAEEIAELGGAVRRTSTGRVTASVISAPTGPQSTSPPLTMQSSAELAKPQCPKWSGVPNERCDHCSYQLHEYPVRYLERHAGSTGWFFVAGRFVHVGEAVADAGTHAQAEVVKFDFSRPPGDARNPLFV